AAELDEPALAIDPGHYSAAIYAGRHWLAAGEPERARRYFERAHTLRPDAAAPLAGLAVALLRTSRAADARDRLAQAARLDAADPEVRSAASEIYGKMPRSR